MFKVLIVDDEAIILSGVKFLLDWNSHDCVVVGTAQNGQQALDLIDAQHPDIVIADINMPLMDGLELLKVATQRHPSSVFIMLTCLEEFRLVQEALRLHAVEYLIKTDLDQTTLSRAIEQAKTECLRRRTLLRTDLEKTVAADTAQHIVAEILPALGLPGSLSEEHRRYLWELGMTTNHALMQVQIEYPPSTESAPYTSADYRRMYDWQGEILDNLVRNTFSDALRVKSTNGEYHYIRYYLWNLVPSRFPSHMKNLASRLRSASSTITGLGTQVLSTPSHPDVTTLDGCRAELNDLHTRFFSTSRDNPSGLHWGCNPTEPFQPSSVALNALSDRIQTALRSRNPADLAFYVERAVQRLQTETHTRGHALWLCEELTACAMEELRTDYPTQERTPFRQDLLPYLGSREAVCEWLNQFVAIANTMIGAPGTERPSIVDSAKKFVFTHITDRIMLQDVADAVGVSPGYLSSLFTKQCGQSLIEYVGKVKTNYACDLMKQSTYRIYEICSMLGYDNSYYFSKLFKKHTGLSPTEYLHRVKKNP